MSKTAQRRLRTSRGFTLIEVLVSIVILSFGLLGMVGLQAASLQANRDARLQSAAIVLARELAEMMRGNKAIAIKATESENPFLGDFGGGASMTPRTASYCMAIGSTCTTARDSANAEMTEWLARVDSELPGAHVKVCRDTAPFDTEGRPIWDCTSAANTDIVVVKIGWTRASTLRSTSDAQSGLDRATRPSVVLPVTAGSSL